MTAFVHLYPTHAVAGDGETIISVPLTDEQIVQLAADATELAAKILRWESRQCAAKKSSTDSPSSSQGRK